MSLVKTLNGFFSVVVEQAAVIVAAVDRIRSQRLFYAIRGGKIYFSDDARWIWKELHFAELNKCSCAEFLLTGYVTGPYTLVDGVRQVQPGEVVWVDLETGLAHTERYYRFTRTYTEDSSTGDLLQQLDLVTRRSIFHLAEYAGGRPIVIPLSGGMDSRLIAMHLKLIGYSPVYAFSYGRKGNRESEVSRGIAQQLGIPWIFVPYSQVRWRRWYESPQWKSYVPTAEGLSSVAALQDWPAVWQLRDNHKIPDDAVFVPGHSADFIAGSHIPIELLRHRRISSQQVTAAVLAHHYVLSPIDRVARLLAVTPSSVVDCVRSRIASAIRDLPVSSVDDAVSAYECWDLEERQAKFIVNSVQVYNFWQFDWWLPWWDAEFMLFWRHVPLRQRVGKQLYDTYVEQVQRRLGLSVPVGNRHLLSERVKRTARRFALANYLISVVRQFRVMSTSRGLQEYNSHPMAWYGITEWDRYWEMARHGGNINTILAIDQLLALLQVTGYQSTRCVHHTGG